MDALEVIPVYDIVKVEKKCRWALRQFSTGKLLSKYKYIYIEYLGNGFFKVHKSMSLCGVIRYDGVKIISCNFLNIENLGNGFFKVEESNDYISHYGIIRYDGVEILSCEYSNISIFYNNSFFLVEKNNKRGLYNLFGEEILPCIYDIIINDKDFVRIGIKTRESSMIKTKWGICNFRGHLMLDVKYEDIANIKDLGITKFNFNIYQISKKYHPESDYNRPFSNRQISSSYMIEDTPLYSIINYYIDKNITYYIMVDSKSSPVIEPDVDCLKDVFLDFSLIPIPSDYIEPVSLPDGNIVCRKRHGSNSHFGLIDSTRFEVILPFKYNKIEQVPNAPNVYQVTYKKKTDILVQDNVSKQCKKIINEDYLKIEYCGDTGKLAILYSLDKKCAPVSLEDGKLLTPCIYTNAEVENYQIIALKKINNKKEVKIDIFSTESKVIIRNNCDDIKSNLFYYGIDKSWNSWIPFGDRNQITIAIKINGKWQLLNANLEEVGLPLYDDIEFLHDGIGCYNKSDLVTIFDRTGHYELNYDMDIYDFHDAGASWEELGRDEENYIINNGGDWILDND